jgi:hypothetical protein
MDGCGVPRLACLAPSCSRVVCLDEEQQAVGPQRVQQVATSRLVHVLCTCLCVVVVVVG